MATRTFAVTALAGLALVLAGCGTEDATGGSADSGGSAGGVAVEPEADLPPSTAADTGGGDSGDAKTAFGTVILNQRLDVPPADYPLPDVPTEAEVATVAELGRVFAVVPGIDDIVADLQGTELDAGDRLFVYVVNACRTDQIKLTVQGDEVPMVVSGTATLRCAPPTTMVVWVVGDEIPADAKPAHAIQK